METANGSQRLFDRRLIERGWKNEAGGFGSIEMWDAAAGDYRTAPIPSFDEPFLRMMVDLEALTTQKSILDIGCGTGVYSIALAKEGHHVVGCDLSAKMIAAAQARAHEERCDSASFRQGDFKTMDIPQRFDVVFAHLTPAVDDAMTFNKMMSLSTEWCFMAKPVRRTDSLLFEARRRCGIPATSDSRDEGFLSAFSLAWLSGATPEIRSYGDTWNMKRPLDVALPLYANQLVAPDLTESQKSIVFDLLREKAEDGMVNEHIETTVVMMGWRKR